VFAQSVTSNWISSRTRPKRSRVGPCYPFPEEYWIGTNPRPVLLSGKFNASLRDSLCVCSNFGSSSVARRHLPPPSRAILPHWAISICQVALHHRGLCHVVSTSAREVGQLRSRDAFVHAGDHYYCCNMDWDLLRAVADIVRFLPSFPSLPQSPPLIAISYPLYLLRYILSLPTIVYCVSQTHNIYIDSPSVITYCKCVLSRKLNRFRQLGDCSKHPRRSLQFPGFEAA
jgi:hypothetical protein